MPDPTLIDPAAVGAVAKQAQLGWSDVAAIIGAAAWLPVVFTWISKLLRRPQVSIITDNWAELGYTSYGSILNFRLALAADKGSVVITNMKIELTHESGEKRAIEWQSMVHNYGAMTIEGQKMPMEKDQRALAMKVGDTEVEEKSIRFQDPVFNAAKMAAVAKVIERINHLSRRTPTYHDELLASDEAAALMEHFSHGCWWKAGKYKAKIAHKTMQKCTTKGSEFELSISTIDIEKLNKNKDIFKSEFENEVKLGLDGFTPAPVNWAWLNPSLVKK